MNRPPPTAIAHAALSLPFAVLAACGSALDVDVSGTCFEVQQARIAVNGVTMQGQSLNGVQINGMQMNGVQLNGIQINGIQANGIQANGIQNNGLEIGAVDVRKRASVRLDGGRLIASVDGARLPDAALVGATFQSGEHVVRITAVTLDDVDDRLAWYELAVDGVGPVCGEGARQGVFVAGSFDDSGAYHDDDNGKTVSYACANGVMNKCVAWGYAPWATSADAYAACTRMARADYCGDGVPWTQDGTLIDVYDAVGVQQSGGSLAFEAGWSADGATCVAAPRYDVRDSAGAAVRPSCWDALPRCSSLSEAERFGALLANDSAHTPITACAH